MNKEMLCFNCFNELEDISAKTCPHCGYNAAQDDGKYPLALPHGTVLNGRYITGRVLGQGGFGVTYIANDWKTKQRVAIKEYLPDTMAIRTDMYSVSAYSGERGESFAYGKECFLKEAQTLSEFIGNANIVRVHSYFEEYGTAYFVMDYVEGISFQELIRNHGGKVSWQEAEKYLLPVMDALETVHGKGIVHRDVTPDNIFITGDGTVKLLDFGAARYSLGDKSRSLDVVLKHGFAPKEQYTRHGRQGAYTDVYTVAASFYYAVTGRKPPDSIDRLEEDDLVPPSSFGIDIPEYVEDAILKGMGVQPADRYQSMAEFKEALLQDKKKASEEILFAKETGGIPQTGKNPETYGTQMPKGSGQPNTDLEQADGGSSGNEKRKTKTGIILGSAIGGAAVLVVVITVCFTLILSRGNSGNSAAVYSDTHAVAVGGNHGIDNSAILDITAVPEQTVTPVTPVTPATPESTPVLVSPTPIEYTCYCNASLDSIELQLGDDPGADINSVDAAKTFHTGDYIYCNFSCSRSEMIKSIRWRLYTKSGRLIDSKDEKGSYTYSSWYKGFPTFSLGLRAGSYYFEVLPTDVNGKKLKTLRYNFKLISKSGSGTVRKSEYILPDVAKKTYPASKFKKMSAARLRLARNEIYARHGYIFTDKNLRKYFNSKSWYNPRKKDVKDSSLNKHEKANLRLIKKYEKRKQ